MSTTRETGQAEYVAKMKKNTRGIVAALTPYAGKPNKPDTPKDQVNKLSNVFVKYLAGIAASRHWSSNVEETWQKFWKTWKKGDGSWTESLEYAKKLQTIFNDIEP